MRTCRQGRQHAGDQAVNVKQRHDVEAAILGHKLQTVADVGGRRHQIALRERHDLGPRRGSRGVEHHGHIPGQSVTAVGCGRSCQLAVAWGQGEVACRLLWVGDQVNDAHAQLFSNGNGR